MPNRKEMRKDLPKWPASLPPPVSIGRGVKHHFMSPDEFGDKDEFGKLLHDMYWFSEDLYFVYCEEGKGLGENFLKGIENIGIEIGGIENYFYPHPNPVYENDYVHLPPGEKMHDWQREASKKQMHTRFSLHVSAWKRKELDMAYSAKATTEALNNEEPIVEAKPGFVGFSVNLIAGWRRLKNIWRS